MAFRDWLTNWRDTIKTRKVQNVPAASTTTPATPSPWNPTDVAKSQSKDGVTPYAPYQQSIDEQQKAVSDSPYLAEFARARGMVKQGFGVQQEEAKQGLNRAIASQGGASSGQALRLQSEMGSDLAKAQNESLGQIDVAEAQDRTRRMERAEELGIQKYQFDSKMNFDMDSFGKQMELATSQFGLAQKESIFNQMLALKEAGVSGDDIEGMRSVFDSMRVDTSKQDLPTTRWVRQKGAGQKWERKPISDIRYQDSTRYEYR